jgi:diguanylate cyclase (GGDEF)-like protein
MLGLGAVLVPFLLAAAVGLFYLLPRLVGPMEEIVEEVVGELEPLRHLQPALLMAAMSVNGYLIHGNPSEKGQFAVWLSRVDKAFERARAASFHHPSERPLLESAWEEWLQARRLGEDLLRLPRPVGNQEAASAMERFDTHINRAVALIGQMYDVAHQEVKEVLSVARTARARSVWITCGAFALALAIALFAGATLARSVIASVDALSQGTARLAEGELSHRVAVGSGGDELGRLAVAFNAMAERIEKDHEVLNDIATHDGLTGLLNHRGFMHCLKEEVERWRRYHHSCALLIVDLDHFKTVNDTWGHPAGDEVLRAVAARILREIRPTDRAARSGGEEFAILLPETGGAGALALAERVRAAFAASPITLTSGQAIDLTVSIGGAAFPDDAGDAEGLIAAADRALYAAKQAGRNRVCAGPSSREAKRNVA